MFKNKDSILTLTLSLVIITVCAGLILGLVYGITKEPIARQQELKETLARQTVLPQADAFAEIDMAGMDVSDEYQIIQQVYEGTSSGQSVGYTMSVVTKGYSPNLTLTIGIGADGKVTGVDIGSHEETPGLGANATDPAFLGQYTGADGPLTVVKTPTGATGEIEAITGATITSKAVTDAVNLSMGFFEDYLAGKG
jgi:electron transport complex protein RnfG